MTTAEGGRQSRRFARFMFVLIASLLVGYGAYKAWHIRLALAAYQDQPLQGVAGAAR